MNSGFTDGVGVGWEEERKRKGVGGCNAQNHLKEHSCSLFPLHYMLYVVVDLAEYGKVFNI